MRAAEDSFALVGVMPPGFWAQHRTTGTMAAPAARDMARDIIRRAHRCDAPLNQCQRGFLWWIVGRRRALPGHRAAVLHDLGAMVDTWAARHGRRPARGVA